jgi:hypothetical protein
LSIDLTVNKPNSSLKRYSYEKIIRISLLGVVALTLSQTISALAVQEIPNWQRPVNQAEILPGGKRSDSNGDTRSITSSLETHLDKKSPQATKPKVANESNLKSTIWICLGLISCGSMFIVLFGGQSDVGRRAGSRDSHFSDSGGSGDS